MTVWLGSRAYSCILFLNWYHNYYPLGWFTEIRALKSRKTMHPPLPDVLVKSGCVFIGQYLSGAPEADARDKRGFLSIIWVQEFAKVSCCEFSKSWERIAAGLPSPFTFTYLSAISKTCSGLTGLLKKSVAPVNFARVRSIILS